jgi:hypothetical protein
MSDRLRDKVAIVVGTGHIPGQTIGRKERLTVSPRPFARTRVLPVNEPISLQIPGS